MADKTDILIAGAGPTGLMLACQLALHGINFRIIEKNKGPTTQSRALGIHARSVEIFSQMGIADKFLELGKKAKAINYLVKGKVARHIQLSNFGEGLTEFPFVLMLEQSKTERILLDFLNSLGHQVEWDTELISFIQENGSLNTTIRNATSVKENLEAKWLVGADGAKSIVRHILDIPFGGETYPADLFVLDCKVSWELADDEVYIGFSDYGFAAIFPLPEDRCRVISYVPKEAAGKAEITFEDVNNGFAERMQMDVTLSDPKWISRYQSHHRFVTHFRKGKCFLAGDAAHIHSPVGAQGMNTGLQDAYNLAWKLAYIIKGKAKETLLSTYQEERLPFARKLVETTDQAFNVTVSKNHLVNFFRLYIVPGLLAFIIKVKPFARFLFLTVSQLGVHYPESHLSKNASYGNFSHAAPKPGQRLPYIKYSTDTGTEVNIQALVKGQAFLLFLLPGSNNFNNTDLIRETVKPYQDIINIEIIPLTTETQNLYGELEMSNGGFYLVRPDLYIAYRSITFNQNHFQQYLQWFLY